MVIDKTQTYRQSLSCSFKFIIAFSPYAKFAKQIFTTNNLETFKTLKIHHHTF